jgi:hypothetical protein
MALNTLPRLKSRGIELPTDESRFGWLRDSTDAVGDWAELQARMDQDGYLFLPGFLDREAVRGVRAQICGVLAEDGLLDPAFPPEAAIARPGQQVYFRPDIANDPVTSSRLREVIYGPRVMEFFDGFLGGPATHYDFTWLRVISPGGGTMPHCDVVYMGRGTPKLFTAWVPIGDVPLEVGGLIVLEGSHQNEELRAGYCTMDVDTVCDSQPKNQLNAAGFPEFGALSEDPVGTREHIGGRWLTAPEYRMGDLLLFSIFTVHASLDNGSNQIRISSDSRYQLAAEPLDERWIGENPPAHGGKSLRNAIC